VHFKPVGSQKLAEQVSAVIVEQLQLPKAE